MFNSYFGIFAKIYFFQWIVAALFFISQVSSAAPYYRFWQGWKLDTLSYEQFRDAMDLTFIPATVEVGQGKGLLAYLPALLPIPKNRPTDLRQDLPDEIALVVYRSKSQYQLLRATPEGHRYSDLHWDYFNKLRGSQSTEPDVFNGSADIHHAYDVLQSNSDWQKGYAIYKISRWVGPLAKYIEAVRNRMVVKGLKSYLILVETSYVIEYQLWENRRSYLLAESALATLRAGILDPINPISDVRKSSPYASQIQYGEAINIHFNIAQHVTPDPMAFAEQSTEAFAQGASDTEPFGLDGCSPTNQSSKKPSIQCHGHQTVLVWGGHAHTGEFTCDFKFEQTPTGKYLVVSGSETCH